MVALAALLLWFLSPAPDSPTQLGPLPAAPSAAAPVVRPLLPPGAEVGLGDPPGRSARPLAVSDAPTDAGPPSADANELADLAHRFSDATIRAKLAANAKRATEELDRYCELNAKLKKDPLFPDPPGARNAAVFMASRVDWEGTTGRWGTLHLPDTIRAHVGPGTEWLLTVTDTDLAGLDFSWMKQLRAFDVWTFAGDGAADEHRHAAITVNLPNFVSLQAQTKLRFARAYRDGDWSDAVLEVRHLAHLLHTMNISVPEAIGTSLLRIERRAREQATRLGVDLSSLPPLPELATVEAHFITSARTGWFVAPGVPEAVRRRALECSAGQCTTAFEGMSLQSSLRPWAPPGSMESFLEDIRQLGCDTAMLERLARMPPATAEEVGWLWDDDDDAPLLPVPDGGR